MQMEYDEDSFAISNHTATTAEVSVSSEDSLSSESVGNATFDTEECYKIETEKPQLNYRGRQKSYRTKFLSKVGIKLNYEDEQMEWFDTTLPLKPVGGLTSQDFDAMVDAFHIQVEDEFSPKFCYCDVRRKI
eukprot:scaffold1315_cov23-Cyclotella_meneghiniana.AAC.7